MEIYDATEVAYHNGYKAGYQAGRLESVSYAKWLISADGYYPYCSNCKEEPKSGLMTKFCPNCGKRMIGDLNESTN